MKIDFVSDVACPWCAIGLHALEEALRRLGPMGLLVELHLQPFELNPDMPPEGEDVAAYMARKYGAPPERLAATRQLLNERGAPLGIRFGERMRVWNTFDAHRLLHWASLQGADKQLALKHALLTAYHTDGRNPGDESGAVGGDRRAPPDPGRPAARGVRAGAAPAGGRSGGLRAARGPLAGRGADRRAARQAAARAAFIRVAALV